MAADQSGYELYRKPTRREEFLRTMEAVVPWTALCEVIEPHYPKAGNGRPPIKLERKALKAKDFNNQCTRHNGIVDEALKAKNRNNSRSRSRVPAVLKVASVLELALADTCGAGYCNTRHRPDPPLPVQGRFSRHSISASVLLTIGCGVEQCGSEPACREGTNAFEISLTWIL